MHGVREKTILAGMTLVSCIYSCDSREEEDEEEEKRYGDLRARQDSDFM